MATYILGLYSNDTVVNHYTGATYTGGTGSAYRIENDQAHIQNITVTDTQTGTSTGWDYTNTNTSGTESIPTGTISNDAVLSGMALPTPWTVPTYEVYS